jgi:hypothetical protein
MCIFKEKNMFLRPKEYAKMKGISYHRILIKIRRNQIDEKYLLRLNRYQTKVSIEYEYEPLKYKKKEKPFKDTIVFEEKTDNKEKQLIEIDCIYMIENITKKRAYIGMSGHYETRISSHKSLLELGKHACVEMQKDYSNGDEFVFVLLENNSEKENREREIFYIEKFSHTHYLYNVSNNKLRSKRHFNAKKQNLK